MTTLVPFQPTPFALFSFQATLDGQQYAVSTTWNLFGQRWYLNVNAQDGTLVCAEGLTASPAAVNLLALVWNIDGYAVATTSGPHGFLPGATIDLTVGGNAPAAYNGQVEAFVVDPQTLQWPVAENPGPATQLGAVSYDVNLVEQFFQTSSLVFRESSQQFEVSP